MKLKNLTLKGLALGLLLTLGTSSASASENIRINPYLDTNYSIISVLNPTESSLKMKIYDGNGEVLYLKSINSKSIMQKLFDFSYLEDGTYRIVLNGKEKMFEKKFEVTNSKLAVASKPQNTEKTLFRSKNNALIVSYITQKNKDFKLSIADASGNRIFDANYTSDPVFQKKFDISALPKGEYNVRVVSDEKAYNYAFKK